MAALPSFTRQLGCLRSLIRTQELIQPHTSRRTITTKYTPKPQPADLPKTIPPAFLSQLPGHLRPDLKPKRMKIYPPPASAANTCKEPLVAVTKSQMAILDPTGERNALFDYRRSRRSVNVGDIIRVTFKNGDPFAGVCLNIRLRGTDTACLLRNQFTKVGVEMWVKVFSPNVEGVEIVQRTEKRKRRARLYYMRQPRHDMGSVENIVSNYLKRKASLTGGRSSMPGKSRK